MIDANGLPNIKTFFKSSQINPVQHLFHQSACLTLKELLPETLWQQEERTQEGLRKKMDAALPLVRLKIPESNVTPVTISFFGVYRYRINAFKFFFDLVTHWLIPGKNLEVAMVNAIDFAFPVIGNDSFTLCEVTIGIDNLEDLETIQRNFPLIETEARLGLDSEYYARKILEIKGVSSDQKIAIIQQHIAYMTKRLPQIFSKDVFNEMRHIFVLCHDDFKKQRSISHLSRLIGAHYLFRKQLLELMANRPDKRHVLLKFFKSSVNFPQGKKHVLIVVVGLNFLREKEVFEERHLIKAIKRYVPEAAAIDQTFFNNRRGSESFVTVHMEIEKNNGQPFTSAELIQLKTHLSKDLQNHIGRLMFPVFMPRNEEEIMRNILSLSSQLKYLRDLPQVFIFFDEQTDRNLFFTVIFLRILRSDDKSIQDKIRSADSFLRYIHDRTRIVGLLRKKYPKEATVFRVKFSKENFLRGDLIDIYEARQVVVSELSRILGEFRDFNGGMISKQNELLTEVRKQLAKEGIHYNEIHLENFFYSLAPVIMRAVLEPMAFKMLFQLLMVSQEKGLVKEQKYKVKIYYDTDFSYVIMTAHHRFVLDEFARALNKSHLASGDLVQGYSKTSEYVSMGYIYRSMDALKQAQFREFIETLVDPQLITVY